jgi:hypothetical protein
MYHCFKTLPYLLPIRSAITSNDVVILQIVIMVGAEWAECGQLVHACVGRAARALVARPSAEPDLAEALFATLHMLTKKRPQCIDWIEDLLPELVELGEEFMPVSDVWTVSGNETYALIRWGVIQIALERLLKGGSAVKIKICQI